MKFYINRNLYKARFLRHPETAYVELCKMTNGIIRVIAQDDRILKRIFSLKSQIVYCVLGAYPIFNSHVII